MTTPINETRGWTGVAGPVAGSRNYTHPQYDGCKIYDAGAGGAITVYCNGETVSEHDSIDEAIDWTVENVVAINRDDQAMVFIRRRETISAIDHERYVRGIAEILDPSAFDGSDPSGDGPAGQHRRDAARATARDVLKVTGAPEPTDVTMADKSIELAHHNAGTVDPNRVVPTDEVKALVTIETAEKLARLAISVLGRIEEAPAADVVRKAARARLLLSHLAGELTTRTVTAVKRQELSDQIAVDATDRFRAIMDKVDPPLEFTAMPEGFVDKAPGASKSQRAFDVPAGGYAVFTRLNDGRVEVEYTHNRQTVTLYNDTPDQALAALIALAPVVADLTADTRTDRERNWGAPGGRVEGS